MFGVGEESCELGGQEKEILDCDWVRPEFELRLEVGSRDWRRLDRCANEDKQIYCPPHVVERSAALA